MIIHISILKSEMFSESLIKTIFVIFLQESVNNKGIMNKITVFFQALQEKL